MDGFKSVKFRNEHYDLLEKWQFYFSNLKNVNLTKAQTLEIIFKLMEEVKASSLNNI